MVILAIAICNGLQEIQEELMVLCSNKPMGWEVRQSESLIKGESDADAVLPSSKEFWLLTYLSTTMAKNSFHVGSLILTPVGTT